MATPPGLNIGPFYLFFGHRPVLCGPMTFLELTPTLTVVTMDESNKSFVTHFSVLQYAVFSALQHVVRPTEPFCKLLPMSVWALLSTREAMLTRNASRADLDRRDHVRVCFRVGRKVLGVVPEGQHLRVCAGSAVCVENQPGRI